MTQMNGRTVLVTGGTGGIGKETARGLARLGARLLLVGRDAARAEAAARELRRDTGNDDVRALTADVTRQKDLRALARRVEEIGALHVLLNNAGVSPPGRTLTEDGVETTFAGNVVAPYLLTRLLLPLLRASGRGRVVNITGGVPRGRLDPANLQAEKFFIGWLTDTQYNRSKLALMAMSRTLAEVAAGEGDVTVNVAYPGHAYTSMNRALRMSAFPVLLRPIVPVLRLIMPYVYGDLEKPARNGIRLASDPALDGVTGAYFDIKGENAAWPPTTGDPRVRAAVWELCERLAPVSG